MRSSYLKVLIVSMAAIAIALPVPRADLTESGTYGPLLEARKKKETPVYVPNDPGAGGWNDGFRVKARENFAVPNFSPEPVEARSEVESRNEFERTHFDFDAPIKARTALPEDDSIEARSALYIPNEVPEEGVTAPIQARDAQFTNGDSDTNAGCKNPADCKGPGK